MSQMNVWIYPEPPNFCHKIPTFFTSFLLHFLHVFISKAPTFLLLFHMKSLESLLVDSSTIICWTSIFVILGVSGLFCRL